MLKCMDLRFGTPEKKMTLYHNLSHTYNLLVLIIIQMYFRLLLIVILLLVIYFCINCHLFM